MNQKAEKQNYGINEHKRRVEYKTSVKEDLTLWLSLTCRFVTKKWSIIQNESVLKCFKLKVHQFEQLQ